MNNKSMKFIRTSSVDARQKLQELGFQEIITQSNEFCFMNDFTLKFSEDDLPKQIIYTNIIHL